MQGQVVMVMAIILLAAAFTSAQETCDDQGYMACIKDIANKATAEVCRSAFSCIEDFIKKCDHLKKVLKPIKEAAQKTCSNGSPHTSGTPVAAGIVALVSAILVKYMQ